MPNYSESLIPNARAAKDASSTGGTAQTTLVALVVTAIIAACDASAYTCTASVAAATSENLQYLLEVLHTCGYTAQVVGTTLTVTWGGA